MRIIVLFLLATCLHSVSTGDYVFASVYTWQDNKGVTHFTDNPESIPPAYRKKAESRDLGESVPTAAPKTEQPAKQWEGSVQNPSSEQSDGKGKEYWQNRFKAVRFEMKGLQDGLASKREEMNNYRRKWLVSQRRVERQNMNQVEGEIAKDEERIRELEKQLEALDVEAARNAVPFDWRK